GTTTEPPGVGNAINYVPTEFELTSEFIYHTPCDGCIVDFTGDYVPELKVFRLPAREESNIETVTSKANSYTPSGSALLVAEHTQDSNFGAQLDSVSGELGGYGITKVYLDEVAANNGLTLPGDINEVVALAQTQMIGEINGGQRLVMFDGHGSPGAWTFNMLFTDSEAGNLTNSSPNVVIPLACYTTYYESPGTESLADQLLFNPSGGSVVVSGAAVLSSLVDNGLFAERILEKMCTGKNLAEAVFETKVENATVTDQVINWDTIGNGFATIDSCY
ncbi:MAG: C25 family cysteine peptidase, partial [Thermodesulfobacteriota bacterium]